MEKSCQAKSIGCGARQAPDFHNDPEWIPRHGFSDLRPPVPLAGGRHARPARRGHQVAPGMTARRILLTGGNGYVGQRLAPLLAQGGELCIADSLRYGDWRFGAADRARIRLARIDIRDHDSVAGLMQEWRPDVIVHLAAIHYIPECETDPALAVSTNVTGTINLLQAAPPGSRFVFASSGAVYRPEERPHHELSSEVGPADIYGLSKLHGEHYVRAMAAKRGLSGVVVRLFNVAGPGETNPHLLPELVAQLRAGRRTIELGNLSPRRDYIDVRDAATGFAAAALGEAVIQGDTCVVNLGTSQTHSVEEVVTRLRRISGVDFQIVQKSDRIRAVDRPILAADISRIRALFGWQPRYGLDDSLAALWSNPDLSIRLMAQYPTRAHPAGKYSAGKCRARTRQVKATP